MSFPSSSGLALAQAASLPASVPMPDPARWPRRFALMLGLIAFVWMLQATDFAPWRMLDARSLAATRGFVSTMFPPSLDPDFLAIVARETWRTVAIATCGMTLALIAAIPLALAGSSALSVSQLGGGRAPLRRALRHIARGVGMFLRTVPELVWALVFVRVTGLGPSSGVLAIGLAYGGMLGKVYAETLESAEAHAARALLINGSGRLQALCFGLLPDAAAELVSYTVYRWECAIRSSVVLGFVGAGGLGQQLDSSVKMLAGGEVSTVLIVLVALVAGADLVSGWLRARPR
jgi:phosphonate transport system permease protein